MDTINIAIIGGGVVGCAIARSLASRWDDVFLLEALPRLGMLTSTRNSGVIHSGLYYTPGSLKAKHCVRGNHLTYEFCAAHNVPFRNTGKLVVAQSADHLRDLEALCANGSANGVTGIRLIDAPAIRAREPHVQGAYALDVPSTGILSSEELVKAYARVATDRGAQILTNAKVQALDPRNDAIRVSSAAGDIQARCVINSAGLFADEIAAKLGSKLACHRIYPVRGEYCELVRSKQDWVRGLVYPLPHADALSLGAHLTKTLAGGVLIGPTALYITDKNDYEKGRESIDDFVRYARVLLPDITPADLVLAYSGIRPKLTPPGKSPHGHSGKDAPDFIIQRDPDIPRVIHLIGIESPGLTSAPAIAEHVTELAAGILA